MSPPVVDRMRGATRRVRLLALDAEGSCDSKHGRGASVEPTGELRVQLASIEKGEIRLFDHPGTGPANRCVIEDCVPPLSREALRMDALYAKRLTDSFELSEQRQIQYPGPVRAELAAPVFPQPTDLSAREGTEQTTKGNPPEPVVSQ